MKPTCTHWRGLALLFALLPLACCAGLPAAVDGESLPSLAPMLEKVTPAGVNISTSTFIREREHPLFSDPFFRHFFGVPDSQRSEKRESNSLGSGVIIDAKEGYVITNHHVIDKADEITVTLQDGRAIKADLVGADGETDIALLKIPAHQLNALKLADSDKLRVGDFVVAIGNPFGLSQTVTSGIVSALGRSGLGIEGYEDFIQTDASINPGNSGGALVNLRGELVGINTAILAPSGGNVGIGFAIPVNMVKQVIEHLERFGEVQRGSLGVQAQDLTPDLAAAFGLAERKGALVVQIDKNSAAEKAGLQAGDIITAFNGKALENSTDLRNRIGLLRVGQSATLTVLRKGRGLTLTAVVAAAASLNGESLSPYLKGADFSEVKVETPRGDIQRVMVQEIVENSPAWGMGLRKGDVILSINRVRVQTLQDLGELINHGSTLVLRIMREDSILTLLVR